MVKTEEAAHGRRVEKRRVEGAGVGSAQDVIRRTFTARCRGEWGGRGRGRACAPCGGANSKYDGKLQVCCISNCPCLRMYQMCRR
jgi:hypothetical protein